LQVFDGSHLPNLESIALLPKSCRRLHLSHCSSLGKKTEMDLEPFTELDFIDLSDSKSLRTIASFPDKVRYANLRGADALNLFLTQSIGEVDRQQEENAAKLLHLRKRFGHQRKIAPFAKLLLIGDGRVGKSTLACRLQRKKLPIAPTHGIEFWPWETNFQLTPADAQNLKERCQPIGPTPDWKETNQLSGTVHLWDFGGQAYYHNTHRLFASAGTVFLICWKQEPTTKEQLEAEYLNLRETHRLAMQKEEWIESNRPRTLDYWFDYVDAVSKNAKIALVCTHCPDNSSRKPWTAFCSDENKRRNPRLECFYIDSKSDDDWQNNPDAEKLVKWIEQACGDEAIASGIDAPAVFADTIALITEIKADKKLAHKMLPWDAWAKKVRSKQPSLPLQDDDIETITKYLHGSGHLFLLDKNKDNRAVLIDQQWGADRIYDILDPKKNLFPRVRENDGYLWIDEIRDSDEWPDLNDPQKDLLLEYMERCQLIYRIPNSKLVIVLEPWLLPPRKEVSGLDEQLSTLESRISDSSLTIWSYDQEKVSETQFRSLMKALAEKLQKQCRWFREGMYASRVDDQAEAHLLVKLDKKPDDYHGRLQVRLFTNDGSKSTQGKLCNLLREAGFDVPDFKSNQPLESRTDFDPHIFFGDTPEPQPLVAISSSGGDKAIVQQIHDELKKQGLKPTWYRDGECRLGKYANAMVYMDSLLQPPILLICLSDHYLRYQPDDGWYCSYEFARGVDKYYGKSGLLPGAIVIYIEDRYQTANATPIETPNSGGKLNPDNMVATAKKIFGAYALFFHQRFITDKAEKSKKLQAAFTATVDAEWDQLERDFGSSGIAHKVIRDENQNVDCSKVIHLVRDMMSNVTSKP
jgi:GTPase SAR1 family protein